MINIWTALGIGECSMDCWRTSADLTIKINFLMTSQNEGRQFVPFNAQEWIKAESILTGQMGSSSLKSLSSCWSLNWTWIHLFSFWMSLSHGSPIASLSSTSGSKQASSDATNSQISLHQLREAKHYSWWMVFSPTWLYYWIAFPFLFIQSLNKVRLFPSNLAHLEG